MQISDITNPLFRDAVIAIDTGNIILLEGLLRQNPQLLAERSNVPAAGYFGHPYLLWFIADNPIRNKTLPPNIVAITQMLVDLVQTHAPETFQEQVDYTLGLVVTGRTPHECGVQLALMGVLIDAGAATGNGHAALANGNTAAAQHLIERGGPLILATAVCLDRKEAINELLKTASDRDLAIALVAAAFYGKADMIRLLLEKGADVNAKLDASTGFHSHATALHQAVSAASMEAVQLLVAAGADTAAKDTIYAGTSLEWAQHLQAVENDPAKEERYAAIEKYLLDK